MVDFRDDVAFVGAFFVGICDDFCDAEGVGVKWCLRDEAVWEGNSEEACYSGCETEEEEVPVEACGFPEGELGALGY